MTRQARRPIPFYYWPFWMVILAAGLFVFYVVFTPIWMGIRFISWLAERRGVERASPATEREAVDRRLP
jgi:hypothetical protein